MKKYLLLIAITVSVFGIAKAQTEQGKWLFAGNTSISFATTNVTPEFDDDGGNETTLLNLSLTPSVNYFVIDNLAVGLDLQFTSAKTDDGDDEVTSNTFAVLPGATYFFNGNNLKPYVGLNVGFFNVSNGDDDSLKSNGFGILGKGGVQYFINDTVAVNIFAQYLNNTLSNKKNEDIKVKNSGLAVGLGFSIFL